MQHRDSTEVTVWGRQKTVKNKKILTTKYRRLNDEEEKYRIGIIDS